ncbi:MAG: hypothetical protein K1X74_11975 [Pirellulales bacterium]|nr:hypothetical protein [Pirellulales bacterium]
MSRLALFRAWLRPGDWRPAREIDADIREELEFHYQALVDAGLEQGLTLPQAESTARDRFGPFERHARDCQWVDRGDRIMLVRILLVYVLVLTGAILYLFFGLSEERAEKQRLVAMLERQAVIANVKAAVEGDQGPVRWKSLNVVAQNEAEPIADAQVLVYLKTWPDGRFQGQPFAAKTNAEGRAVFKDLLPANRRHGIAVSVFAPEHAFAFHHQIFDGTADDGAATAQTVLCVLEPADRFVLTLVDPTGQPIADAAVKPSRRQTETGVEHLAYHSAADPVQLKTDTKGQVSLDWFKHGDQAEISVQLDHARWEPVKFAVPPADQPIVVPQPAG